MHVVEKMSIKLSSCFQVMDGLSVSTNHSGEHFSAEKSVNRVLVYFKTIIFHLKLQLIVAFYLMTYL